MSIRKLKKIHEATHPAARLNKKGKRSVNGNREDEQRKALLEALDAEAEEESE